MQVLTFLMIHFNPILKGWRSLEHQPIKLDHQKLMAKICQTIKLNHQKLWQTLKKFDYPNYFEPDPTKLGFLYKSEIIFLIISASLFSRLLFIFLLLIFNDPRSTTYIMILCMCNNLCNILILFCIKYVLNNNSRYYNNS